MANKKIYYFFVCGEMYDSCEAKDSKQAVEIFLRWGYTDKDCQYAIEYNKKTGKYRQIKLECPNPKS